MDRDESSFLCACCGEANDLFIDQSGGDRQTLIEDCAVCCRPNVVSISFNPFADRYDIEVTLEGRD